MSRRIFQVIDPDSGLVLKELHLQNGVRHRDSSQGPALTRRDWITSELIEESYYQDGWQHRRGGPAVRKWDGRTGVMTRETYIVEGIKHRLDGPADVERDPYTGVVTTEYYYQGSMLHRTDGPALITRNELTGFVNRESYYIFDQMRDMHLGAGTVYYDEKTGEKEECYFVDEKPVPSPNRPARKRRQKPKSPER